MPQQKFRRVKMVGQYELPVGKREDVEFSEELADSDDKKAQQRAAGAAARQEQ